MASASLLASLQAPAFGADVPQFLTLPFNASDKHIAMQRAWWTLDPNTGTFTLLHHGIDWVNGTRDVPITWKPFDVLAAAGGEACGAKTGQGGCFDDGEIMGNRVLIKHNVDGQIYYTFYNHLATIASNIPLNNVHRTVHVDAGDKIGVAGDSASVGLLHLHFELLGADMKPIDPYGIYGITDQYPDARGKNGKDAGKKNYFLTDPPQPFGFAPKPAKASPTTDAVTSTGQPVSSVPTIPPLPTLVATPTLTFAPIPTPVLTAAPTPTPTALPVAAALPPADPPQRPTSDPDLVPMALGLGVVVVVVVLAAYGRSRLRRRPLSPDRRGP